MYGPVASLAERVYDDVEKQAHFDSGLCTSNTPNAIVFWYLRDVCARFGGHLQAFEDR